MILLDVVQISLQAAAHEASYTASELLLVRLCQGDQ